MHEKTSWVDAVIELDGFKRCVCTVGASQDEQDWNLSCAWIHLLQPNQALVSIQVAARLFEGWWKDAKEMKKYLSENCKTLVSVFFIACVLNINVLAQVSSSPMKCTDTIKNISFSVHFKGGEVLLELKSNVYRIPYEYSFVSRTGERWSVYRNREIDVSTTLPYDKYVDVITMSSGNSIATAHCH